MPMIVHITGRDAWQRARRAGLYAGDTLETEGFIHCSTPQQVIRVADARFHGRRDLLLLCIDRARVQPPIRYEASEGTEQFPHIYGPLNLDAVVEVLSFEPESDGRFRLPEKLDEKPPNAEMGLSDV